MKASFDLSIYPLHKDFEKPIKDFIRELRQSGFQLIETPLSTQIYGDFNEVMTWLTEHLNDTLTNEEHCVVTLKILKGDRSHYHPFRD
ncbi:MAG TPA: hypothetical protein ENK67_01735 [Flavobacteriia bacterium]|jgi:uncharacterized protein YqgV (UPF0045/DUF77 family)|nr:hypothetical protein [Flavobacteriia bacterium]